MKTWITSVFQIPPTVGELGWCKVPTEPLGTYVETDLLLPTIVECLAVIVLGYVAGALAWVSEAEVRGISFFCSHVTLLPLIFLNLATMDMSAVNWTFVAAILVSKLALFSLVTAIFGLIHRASALHTAALYGIFVTQTNDFGMAYPLVSSLFGHKHPLYAGYMYLIAPTSLVVVNPLGFAFMEGAKNGNSKGLLHRLGSVTWGVLRNPIVNVTFFGVLANLLMGAAMPDILYSVLKVLASAFSASVLFLLGYLCSRPSSGNACRGILGPAILVAVKTIVSPLVTKTVVGLMCHAADDLNDLANYGFLYGMVPSAPIVLLFAQHYGLPTDVIARGLATCTFLSGPVIYLMAKVASMDVSKVTEYMGELRFAVFFLSTFSLACTCWMLLTVVLTGRFRSLPYKMTGYLLAVLGTMYVGVIFWFKVDLGAAWGLHLQLAPILTAQLASRLWTGLLAAALLLDVQYRGRYNRLLHQGFLLLGIGIPLIISIFLISTEEPVSQKMSTTVPIFLYGKKEAALTLVVLAVSLLLTITCLVLYFRIHKTKKSCDQESITASQGELPKDSWSSEVTSSTEELTKSSVGTSSGAKHAALLIVLSISMILGLVVCIWKFLRNDVTGLFMALEFLDVVLNFGQGIIIFTVYWADSIELLLDANNRMRRWYFSRKSWSLTPLEVHSDQSMTCRQFSKFHLDTFRSHLGNHSRCFEGKQLATWLTAAGLSSNHLQASSYIQVLLDGDVIKPYEHNEMIYGDQLTYCIT